MPVLPGAHHPGGLAASLRLWYARGMPQALVHDRADPRRYPLPSPRDLPSGGRVYWVVLATPGILRRNGRTERVPREVLKAKAFVEALPGTPVIDDDRHLHGEGVTMADVGEGAAIGHVLSAKWSDELDALIGEVVIDHPRGAGKVAVGVTGASLAYRLKTLPDDTGEADVVHVWRAAPDNLAITLTPRDERAGLAADADGDRMDPEIKAMLDEMAGMIRAIHGRMMADDADPEEAPAPPPEPTMADMKEAYAAADALGVDIPAGATLTVVRGLIARKADPTLAADAAPEVVAAVARVAGAAAVKAAADAKVKAKSASPWEAVAAGSRAADSAAAGGNDIDWTAGAPRKEG